MNPTKVISLLICVATVKLPVAYGQYALADAFYFLPGATPSFGQSYQVLPTSASTSVTGSSPSSTVNAFAAADLSTGTLKVKAGGALAKPGRATVQADASFSDTFTTTTLNGTPFSWTDASTAQFDITISGVTALSREFTFDDFGAAAFQRPHWMLSLTAATTEDFDRWENGDYSVSLSRAYYQVWAAADLTSDPQKGYDGLFTGIEVVGDLTSGLNVKFNLAPGGDFKWIAELSAAGGINDGFLFDSYAFDIDLSHTAQVSYTGPSDSITHSLSGFPGTSRPVNSVPDSPVSGALGFVLVALLSLHKRYATVQPQKSSA